MNKRQFKKYCKKHNVPRIISVQGSSNQRIWHRLRSLTGKNIVGKHPKNRRRRPYQYYKIEVSEISIPVWPEIEGWSVVDVERATDETIKYTLDL